MVSRSEGSDQSSPGSGGTDGGTERWYEGPVGLVLVVQGPVELRHPNTDSRIRRCKSRTVSKRSENIHKW